MRTLKFIVNGQRLVRDPTCSFQKIISGSKNYLRLSFSFDSEWDGMAKAVEFTLSDSDDVTPVLLQDDMCSIPDSIASSGKRFRIRLVGRSMTTKLVTNRCMIEQEV